MNDPARSNDFASVDAVLAGCMKAWRPPPKLSLSEWADEYFRLSVESAAEAGRWKTLPYQREIMDAISDPGITHVTVMKSARVGYTLMVSASIGYYMHQAPCPILLVQPTVDDAKGFSKETIAPMLRDVPVLSKIQFEDAEENGPKDSGNTILHKHFPGGVLSMVGANSGAGFRRVSRKVVIFDEADAYPVSAGSDGDPIKLGTKRSEYYHDRKILAGSTPLVAGRSRIETLFEAGDQRRYYVPCPECGHMAPFVFSGEAGHSMAWPKEDPGAAYFVCQGAGCVIDHSKKRDMVSAGEWRASQPFTDHASFHIWAAYSFSPNATWGSIAKEFLDVKDNPETFRTFVNTVLGETWRERGDAPDWERLYSRRESYQIGSIPAGVLFLTAGVDVQKDRFVWEIVGWGEGKQSWSIDAGVIPADTANESDWVRLDEVLNRDFGGLTVRMLAVDSGFNTNTVYNWARRHPLSRVIAIKGSHTARKLIDTPSPVDVKVNGRRFARGYKVWPVGVDVAKAELYGWLRLPKPEEGKPYPNGFCHFPEHGEEYFKQLTSEQLVSSVNKRTRYTSHEWQLIPGRENHWLDCRVYARAAACLVGLDRMRLPAAPAPVAPVQGVPQAPAPVNPLPVQQAPVEPRKSGFLNKGGSDFRFGSGRGKGWLSKG